LLPRGSELARDSDPREQARSHKNHKGPAADLGAATAFLIALLWTLHPLQTEAVTYVIQRAESLMGLFFLLTLYAFARATAAERPARVWAAVCVVACLAGMLCKEVMAVAPVVVLLYDRTFVSGTFRAAWRRHRGLHLALGLTWLPLLWLVLGSGGNRGGTFLLTPVAFWQYGLTQFEAVARYLQLSLWPAPLVFEYGVFQAGGLTAVLPYALLVLGLFAATVWALWRRPVAGFLGAAFFLILAPTSLVPGVTQVMAEHRMYLPLAAVLAWVVGAGVGRLGRRGLVFFLVLAVGAGWLTYCRNGDYRSDLTLWQDTVAKRPTSARAQSSLGTALLNRGDPAGAQQHYAEAVRLDPASAQNHYNLGLALDALARSAEAAAHYAEAVRLLPYYAQAHARLAADLIKAGQNAEAYPHLTTALSFLPDDPDAHYHLGLVLEAAGRGDEALGHYREAVRLNPGHAEARLNLGVGLARSGNLPEALTQLTEAVRLRPGLAEAHANLGIVLAEAGRSEEAVRSYAEALRLRPDYATAHYNLGNALVNLRRWSEARTHFAEALRLAPDFDAAREMLERLKAAPAGP
jgi:tetratricopeptide (TPR) repeat protein